MCEEQDFWHFAQKYSNPPNGFDHMSKVKNTQQFYVVTHAPLHKICHSQGNDHYTLFKRIEGFYLLMKIV